MSISKPGLHACGSFAQCTRPLSVRTAFSLVHRVDRVCSSPSAAFRGRFQAEATYLARLKYHMRKREILGPRRSDVNLRDRFIAVREAKGERWRLIPIGDELTEMLPDVIVNSRGSEEYVACRNDGRPYLNVRCSFSSALRKARIRDFTLHDLRHIFRSHFMARGGDILVPNKNLGH